MRNGQCHLKQSLRSHLCSEKHWLFTWVPVTMPGTSTCILCLSLGSNSHLTLYIGLTMSGYPAYLGPFEDQCKDESQVSWSIFTVSHSRQKRSQNVPSPCSQPAVPLDSRNNRDSWRPHEITLSLHPQHCLIGAFLSLAIRISDNLKELEVRQWPTRRQLGWD